MMNSYSLLQRTRTLWAVLLFFILSISSFAQVFIQVGSGTATTPATGGAGTAAVYNRWWESRRTQVIYTAAELTAAGFAASAPITALALYVETDIDGTLPNFSIKMKHTTATSFTAFDGTGLTTVHTSTPSGTGATIGNWVTFNFTTSFTWNGTDNLLIDFCHGVSTTYNATGVIRQYTGAANSLRSVISISENQCPVTTGGTNGSDKPQIRLTVTPPTSCSGTPPVLTATASSSVICSGGNVTLSVPLVFASGITYQWQANTGSGFANIAGATSPTSVVSFSGVSTQYRCVVTCTNSGISTNSTTVTVNPRTVLYASLPYTQNFDGTWVNGCNTRDVPDLFWWNTPSTGNQSWRRNDDGASANWTSPTFGAYTPTGALGSPNSARFHSSYAFSGTTGDLDFYVNLSPVGPKLLNFYHINTSGTDVLNVFLSTNGGATFSPIASFGTAGVWTLRSVFINSNSPTTVIRFRGVADYGSTDIGIDQLSINLATVVATGLNGNIIGSSSLADVSNGTNYGGWYPGVQVERTFYIKNVGATNLNVFSISSSNATNFPITGFPVVLVAPGDSTAFKVKFTANAPGTYTSTITFLTSGSPNPYTFQVSGTIGDFVSSYTFAQCSGTYSEITGGTIPTITSSTFGAAVGQPMSPGNDLDDVSATGLPIGFTFNFNGVNYTDFSVNSNGYLVLGGTLPGNSNYNPISSTISVPGIVSALSGDLQATSGEIRYEVQGTAPNRVLVVQWKNFFYFGATGDVLNFQIRLHENSNQIRIVYGNITKNPIVRNVQVGLRGATNGDFNNRMSTTSWTATMRGTANNSTITFSPSIIPPAGLTFIWSPRPVKVFGGTPLAEVPAGSITPSVANGTDFGSAAVGEVVTVPFTITNYEGSPLNITSITSSNPNFTISSAPTSIGGVCGTNSATFNVNFSAAAAGTYTSTITINNSSSSLLQYTFVVKIVVANPAINIQGGVPLTAIANGSTTPSTANGTDFGGVVVGNFVEQTYTINNLGVGALKITAVNSSNPRFTVTVPPTSPVPSGGSTTFTVRFTPITNGVQNATISVVNNTPGSSPYTFAVTGLGLQPAIQVLGLSNNIPNNKFLPTSTDGTFLGASTGGNLTGTFTIRNTGNQPLTISSITSPSNVFAIANIPATIAPTAEADFTVTYNPNSGNKQDTIIIVSNAINAPVFRFMVAAGGVVSALDDNLSEGEVIISPNPSRDKFNIRIGGTKYTSVKAVVYDVTGKVIKTAEVPQFSGNMDIDLSEVQGGTYILMLETGGEKIARKLVKQ